MKLSIIFILFSLGCTAQIHNFKVFAGPFLLENASNVGLTVLAYNNPECVCGKWSKRFNPYIAVSYQNENHFLINAGTLITVFDIDIDTKRISAGLIPYYLKYNIKENGYSTPIGFYLQLSDRPLSMFIISDWYKESNTIQIMLTYQFFNKQKQRA